MVAVLLPLRRFSTTSDHHARAILGAARRDLDGRRKMHGKRYRTDHSTSVVHEANELSDVGPADQIDHTPQARMEMMSFSALDELDSPGEMVHDLLVADWVPPLCRVVVFAARDQNPEWPIPSDRFLLHLVQPRLLLTRQVNVAPELAD